MHAEQSISVLESLITLSGNADMPLSQAIVALRALSQGSAVSPAPVLRAPVVNTAHFDEAVNRANSLDMVSQAINGLNSDEIAFDVPPACVKAEPAEETAAPVKKRRGRPRKNKA